MKSINNIIHKYIKCYEIKIETNLLLIVTLLKHSGKYNINNYN